MKDSYSISKSSSFANKEINLNAWVFNKRSSGSVIFLQLRDGTGFIQAVIAKNEVDKDSFQDAKRVSLESSVNITALIKQDKRAPSGFELSIRKFKIISQSADDFPIGKKEHGPDFLLNNRHLWLRSKRQWAILRVRNQIINAIYAHLNSEGFIKIDSPVLTPTACEGTTTLFPVPYLPSWKDDDIDNFHQKKFNKLSDKHNSLPFAYLSQSGQLYLESAIFSMGKVFDFGPTFRAEKSKTRRHLTEFWMMDAEMAFCDHRDNMNYQQRLIAAIVSEVLDNCQTELNMLDRDVSKLLPALEGKYEVITHKEAIKMLQKEGHNIGIRDDFGAEAETVLSNKFDRPFFIEKYPKEVKAFYMKQDPDDESRVLNSDMLAPEGYGEIIGGSQREDDYDILLKKIKENGLPVLEYQWYLDLRKFGSVIHSGYGIGLERIVAWVCRLDHVRETIPFPRMLDRFRP